MKLFNAFCECYDSFLESILLIPIKIKIYFFSRKFFKKLGIKPISIEYKYNSDNVQYNYAKNKIYLGKMRLLNINNKKYDIRMYSLINLKFLNGFDKIAFTLAHEIGHYLQCIKYKKWFYKYLTEYLIFEEYVNADSIMRTNNNYHKEYRQLKLEANADKIGIYLCNYFNIGKPKNINSRG